MRLLGTGIKKMCWVHLLDYTKQGSLLLLVITQEGRLRPPLRPLRNDKKRSWERGASAATAGSKRHVVMFRAGTMHSFDYAYT